MRQVWVLALVVVGLCGFAQSQVPKVTTGGSAQWAEVSADKFVLHADLPLILRNKHPLSSELSHAGDVVEFEVVRAITAGDVVLIAKGAAAKGKVTLAQPARRMGKGGELEVSIETVELVTGESVPIHAVWSDDGGGGKKMAGHMAITGALFLPAVALPLLERGNAAGVATGTRFDARLNGETAVSRSAAEAHQPSPQQPQTNVATVYIYREAQGKDMKYWVAVACGEKRFNLYPGVSIGLELPPGEYWFRSGWPAQKSLKRAKLKELFSTLNGGETYYLKVNVNAKKRSYALERIDAVTGDEKVTAAKFLSLMSLDELRPEMAKLQERPSEKK